MSSAKQHVESHARAAAGHAAERLEDQSEQLRKSRDAAIEEVAALKQRLLELVEARTTKVLADLENIYRFQFWRLVSCSHPGRMEGMVLQP